MVSLSPLWSTPTMGGWNTISGALDHSREGDRVQGIGEEGVEGGGGRGGAAGSRTHTHVRKRGRGGAHLNRSTPRTN